MMNCRTATRLFSEGMERPLKIGERLSLRFHCMMCTGCTNYGQQMEALRQITQAYAKGAGDSPNDVAPPPADDVR